VDHTREIATEDAASSEEESEEESDDDDEVPSGKGANVETLPQDLESKAVIQDATQEGKEWQEGADAQMAIAKDIASRKVEEKVEETPEHPRTRVLTVLELEELFESAAPPLSDFVTDYDPQPKLTVGLVGYPNVGKSSTINALLGSKKVSVSATPGKTKHFQTLAFTDKVTLCDCPGLVFPQFVNTEAELVCDGVLPIDQMREASGPIELICRRIPREILEGTYGIRIDVREVEDGGTGRVGWEDLLSAYASTYIARYRR
jgi:large subunit GTPase 1